MKYVFRCLFVIIISRVCCANVTSIDEYIGFHLYEYSTTYVNGESLYIDDKESLDASLFNEKLPTAFIVHGYIDFENSPHMKQLRELMTAKDDLNLIHVNWDQLNQPPVAVAINNARRVAQRLKDFTIFLVRAKKLKYSSIHFIGHSIGAHIVGMAGKQIYQAVNSKIGRLTGLDPAKPAYELDSVPESEKLSKSAALFVDIIHTDVEMYGYKEAAGHVDFFPNGGNHQPNCYTHGCNHMIAVEFWATSVVYPNAFMAYKFDSWESFLNATHLENMKTAPMGIEANSSIEEGKYYLQFTYFPRVIKRIFVF